MRNLIKQRMWKCLIVSAVLFCLAAPLPAGAAVCVQPPSGMVSWWGGDNNALDMIGTNNGTLVNGATYAAGNVGQAFSFDGTNDYVEMTGSSVGDFGSAPFTVDFWMYAASDPTSNAYLIGKSCPNCGAGWDLRFDNSTISVVGVNGWSVNFWSNPSVTVGAWHHIALAATGSSITLYIDGAVSASNPRSAISSTVSPFRIGDNPDYGGSAFNGLVDEVEIFDRALSLAEIQAIYNAGTAGKCRSCTPPPSGMISWWGGDNNGLDMVGTSNGTLVNGATYASGKVGQAFSLDGVNDYIEMTGSSVGDFGSAPFTVDFWMYAASDPTAHAYLLGKSCPDCGNGWDLRFDNNTIWVVGANGWTYFSSNPSVTVGAPMAVLPSTD
ncbi:MAG: laminin G domain-containing protein [Nitrospirae bacterium]|nr:laminin G domain-containing protein [Nitrospirota bacterium]